MKIFTLSLVLMAMCLYSNAHLYTVNNHNPGPGQYADIVAAYTAASAGDTLYISGSATPYATLTVAKKITVIGTGFKPTNKQDASISILPTIILNAGADNSTFIGLTLTNALPSGNGIVDNAASLTGISVIRCSCSTYGAFLVQVAGNLSNLTINGCNASNIILFYSSSSCTISNSIISNNITNEALVLSIFSTSNVFSNVNIFNNVFSLVEQSGVGAYLFDQSFFSFPNCNIYNNIIYCPIQGSEIIYTDFLSSGASNAGSSEYNNTVLGYSTTPNPNPSADAFNGTNVFNNTYGNALNTFTSMNGTTIADYHVQSTSPAHGAGSDGTDLGVYGGILSLQYNATGEPGIPQITSIVAPITSGGTSISVKVSSFSNQ